jgi:hypothetical protein
MVQATGFDSKIMAQPSVFTENSVKFLQIARLIVPAQNATAHDRLIARW